MQKCPACGYHLKSNANMGKEMNRILKTKNKRTVKMLNKIASLITSEIPSETRYKYYQFLYGTKSIEDNAMEWALQKYYEGEHVYHGKGFAYLRVIAQTRGKNIETIKRNERKRLGSVPPVYKGV